jgi:hypothetical protein
MVSGTSATATQPSQCAQTGAQTGCTDTHHSADHYANDQNNDPTNDDGQNRLGRVKVQRLAHGDDTSDQRPNSAYQAGQATQARNERQNTQHTGPAGIAQRAQQFAHVRRAVEEIGADEVGDLSPDVVAEHPHDHGED